MSFEAALQLNNGEIEIVDVFGAAEVELPPIGYEPLGSGRNDKKQRKQYYNIIITLDTETSKKVDVDSEGNEIVSGCWVYQWAFRFGYNTYVAGRSIDELGLFIDRIIEAYENTEDNARIVIWVHNLAYDASYFVNMLALKYKVEMFNIAPHKPIKITVNAFIEFRCSYKLVNKSLAAWCKDVNPRHVKQVGEIDYDVVRTPSTPLAASDWDYMLNDVASQYDCLAHELENEKLSSIPITSTGFVRRELRNASERQKNWRGKFRDMLPTPAQYKLLRRTFAGGYTHCNSWALGIHHDVEMYDAASMYPAVMATELFPMSKWYWRRIYKIDELDELCMQPDTAVISTLIFTNIRLHDMQTWNPYISYSKCDGAKYSDVELDNGKLMLAKGDIIISCTEIDYKWIRKQYDFDSCTIVNCMIARKEPLPKWFLTELKKWYDNKTTLKGAELLEDLRRYMESKQLLNGLYGCCATDPVRDEALYLFGSCTWQMNDNHTQDGIETALNKMQRPYSKQFLVYAWGLYVTAYARDRLFRLLECCGLPLYCDTDSGKGCNWDYEKLAALNAEIEAKSRAVGFVSYDRKGHEHVIGVFESELKPNEKCVRFSALHAKCYGYEISKDGGAPVLHAVIAGVTGGNGQPRNSDKYISRETELGSLERLHDGTRFTACGGTRSVYLDAPHVVEVNGEIIQSYGGCAILPTTYEIGGTVDLLEKYLLHDNIS